MTSQKKIGVGIIKKVIKLFYSYFQRNMRDISFFIHHDSKENYIQIEKVFFTTSIAKLCFAQSLSIMLEI
jgi:hypothetical protein